MTEREKFAVLIAELGEVIHDKNTEIGILQYQLAELKERLCKAEEKLFTYRHEDVETRCVE